LVAKREILAGATDQTIDIFIRDSSSTTGGGLTGLAYNTSSLTCYYRKGATGTPTALTLATQTVGGAHSDGGFVAVDGTHCPGQYRLDLSDTIVATAGMVTLYLQGATNMAPTVAEIEVVAVNKFDGVRMGMTALPNAAAEAAGGLYTRGSGAGQINQSANGQVDVNAATIATNALTASAIAADAGTELANAVLDLTDGIESSVTLRQAMRAIAAMLSGLIADAGTGTETFKGIGQSSGGTTRVTVTADSSGNRSAITLNL
jgi:hypothetical protein